VRSREINEQITDQGRHTQEELGCFSHRKIEPLCSTEITNVLQEGAREAASFSLNCTEIILRASSVFQDLFHAPTSSNAVVGAGKPIFAAHVEESGKSFLDF